MSSETKGQNRVYGSISQEQRWILQWNPSSLPFFKKNRITLKGQRWEDAEKRKNNVHE